MFWISAVKVIDLCTEQFTYTNLFTFMYFTVSVVRQQNEYEKVIETRPIKTT